MMKKILPAAVLSLSLLSCQMGLTNLAGYEGANPRNSIGANVQNQDVIDISYDEKNVTIAIKKSSDATKYDLFINTDGDSEKKNGFSSWLWSDKAANYLIEITNINQTESSLLKFKGKDWAFDDTEIKASIKNEDGKIKFIIPFDARGTEAKGIESIDVGSLSVACAVNDTTAIVDSYIKACETIKLTDDRINVSYDDKYMYVSVNSKKDDTSSLYIDVDSSNSTGYTGGNWTNCGADYLVNCWNYFKFDNGIAWNADAIKDYNGIYILSDVNAKENKTIFKIKFSVIGVEEPSAEIIKKISFAYTSNSLAIPEIPDNDTSKKTSPFVSVEQKDNSEDSVKHVVLSGNGINLDYDNNYMYISIDGYKDASYLFINTDSETTTGYTGANWKNSGVDYFVNNGKLYKFANGPWNLDNDFITKDIKIIDENILVINYADLGIESTDINKLSFAYNDETVQFPAFGEDFISVRKVGTVIEEQLPVDNIDYENLYGLRTYDFSCGKTLGKGIIIPAYFGTDDSEAWKTLLNAVNDEKFQASGKEFYVVINGDPAGFANGTAVADYLAKIQAAGGKIIAYVHTCVAPDLKPEKRPDGVMDLCNKYRSVKTVMSEIDAWANVISSLDGIWLDEFYPRYEIAYDGYNTVGFAVNDCEFTPVDFRPDNKEKKINLTSENGSFYDVDPYGGYYWQLCYNIRKNYENFITIGNAGAHLWTNQQKYSKLVDILVTFEKSHGVARFGDNKAYHKDDPNNPKELYDEDKEWFKEELIKEANSSADKWIGLNLQPNCSAKQLALIHGVGAYGYENAIKVAFDKGFDYVYVIEKPYRVFDWKEEKYANTNLWGNTDKDKNGLTLPSYLIGELSCIADK